ncbi:MAG: lipid A deacylase LpxR family protein [Lautropia sp.]|nr:lipid A deacylase LpxR family protein [Lautropia sp.]
MRQVWKWGVGGMFMAWAATGAVAGGDLQPDTSAAAQEPGAWAARLAQGPGLEDDDGKPAIWPDESLLPRPPVLPALEQEESVMADTPAVRGGPGGSGCRPVQASQLRFKIDNDLASGQDHGYSSGLMLEVAGQLPDDGGFPADGEGWLCPLWRLMGGGSLPRTVSFRLDQNLYTPKNSRARYLLTADRPYAAVLMAGVAAERFSGGQHVRNEIRLGWVGPSVRGEASQNAVHKLINAPHFYGWDNQLGDEPLIELAQYRVRRWSLGRGSDLLGHWGARLGTLQTSAYAGMEWRFGDGLRDDGGSAPLRPGAGEPSQVLWDRSDGPRWTGFLTLGARWVGWDLTLDGNLSRDSHSVHRRPLVLDGGAGVSVQAGAWAGQLMWVLRSKEFDGQQVLPSYGALQISYRF